MAEQNWTNLWGAINTNAEVWDAPPVNNASGPLGFGWTGVDDSLAQRYPIHLPAIRPADGGSQDLEGQQLLDYNLAHKTELQSAGFKVDDGGKLYDNKSANPFYRPGAVGGLNIVSTPFGDMDWQVFKDSAWDGIHNVWNPVADAAGGLLTYLAIGAGVLVLGIILISAARR